MIKQSAATQYGTPWGKIARRWAKLGVGNHPSPIDKYFEIVGQMQDDTIFGDSSYVFVFKPR